MSLMERLEAASEGSRELDAQIALAANLPQEYFDSFENTTDGYPSGGFQEVDGPDCFGGDAIWGGGGRSWEAPHYTTSLDAALTLVPEGFDVDHLAWDKTRACCELGKGRTPSLDPVEAATPALALCAAALKARAVL